MPIDLSKYQVSIDAILKQKQAIEQLRSSREGSGELNWMPVLKDGQQAVIRIIPQPGGLLSKEVKRYRSLGEEKFVSPRDHAGIDDPFYLCRTHFYTRFDFWREQFKSRYGDGSTEYVGMDALLKSINEEVRTLS